MALNFPNDPSPNDTYPGPNGVTYVWDGQKWTARGATTGLPILPDEDGNVTITGNLTVVGNTIGDSLDLSGNLNVAGDIDND